MNPDAALPIGTSSGGTMAMKSDWQPESIASDEETKTWRDEVFDQDSNL